ncbi:MAG: glycosyltransferase [archaeon]
MSGLSEVSLIVPVHNEEKRLPALFSKLALGRFGEVIFVLDGCTDGSESLLPKKSGKIVLGKRKGKGFALRAGFLAARKPIVCFVDADGTFSQRQVGLVCKSCKKNGIAIAERRVFPRERALQRSGLRLISRFFFGLKLKDTQCGLLAGGRKTLAEIIPACKSDGYEFPVELLWRAEKAGARISTVGIRIPAEDYANSTFDEILDPVRMFRSLVRLRLLG